MHHRHIVAAAYDAGVEEEYKRLVETPLREAEFMLISELLEKYVPSGNTVIDIGSGPGRYAEHLLHRNCKVGLVDLSARSLKAFSDRLIDSEHKEKVLFNTVSCATELDWIEPESADAVLLMGPLYHITNEEGRTKAIKQSQRILKKGGFLFSVFMSPYPKLNPMLELTEKEIYNPIFFKEIEQHGVTYTEFKGYNVPQFRCWPQDAVALMEKNGFHTERIRNLEGIGSFMTEAVLKEFNDPEKKRTLFEILRNTCENPNLLGITHQYLYVGMKK